MSLSGMLQDEKESFPRGGCEQCLYCRSMSMFTGGGFQNVRICELSERDDGCVRVVRPDESCDKFKSV